MRVLQQQNRRQRFLIEGKHVRNFKVTFSWLAGNKPEEIPQLVSKKEFFVDL